jgi:hypothetical protein
MKFKKGDYVIVCLAFDEIVGKVHSFNKKNKEYNVVYLEKKDNMDGVRGVPEDILSLTSPVLAELYDL